MTDMDRLLASLGRLPPDPRLAAIDEAVLAGLEAARQPAIPRAALGAVGALALLMGAMAGGLPLRKATSATYPLGVPAQLTPSALLEGGR